jgi:hypothetical protein
MINHTETGPLFTLEDVLRLQRLAASFEFRARTTRHLEEAQDAERVANHLHVLADKVAQHVVA